MLRVRLCGDAYPSYKNNSEINSNEQESAISPCLLNLISIAIQRPHTSFYRTPNARLTLLPGNSAYTGQSWIGYGKSFFNFVDQL
jgi:hypothetical protein